MIRRSILTMAPILAIAGIAAPAHAQPEPTSAPAADDGSDNTGERIMGGERIVGGERAPAGSAPWQAEIYTSHAYTADNLAEDARLPGDQTSFLSQKAPWEWVHRCGAAYIGNGWLVTAAHCFVGTQADIIGTWRVRMGTQDLSPPEKGVTFRMERAVLHKGFVNAQPYPNDIALVHIVSDAGTPPRPDKRYAAIRPLGPGDRPVMAFDRLTVTGWGRTKPRDAVRGARARDGTINVGSPNLLQIVIRTQDAKCRAVPAFAKVAWDKAICAGAQAPETEALAARVSRRELPEAALNRVVMDSCNGDSGGPMTRAQGNERVLVGIVSWGRGCGLPDTPGIYTRVTPFLDWIATAQAGSLPGKVSRF